MTCCNFNNAVTSSGDCELDESTACTINLLRNFINDTDKTHYSDARLCDLMFAAMYSVSADLICCSAVRVPTIDLCNKTVLLENSNDLITSYPEFTLLSLYKSGEIIERGILINKTRSDGIKAMAGPVTVEVKGAASSLGILLEHGNAVNYKNLLRKLCFEAPLKNACFASQILGAYTSHNLVSCDSDHSEKGLYGIN